MREVQTKKLWRSQKREEKWEKKSKIKRMNGRRKEMKK